MPLDPAGGTAPDPQDMPPMSATSPKPGVSELKPALQTDRQGRQESQTVP